ITSQPTMFRPGPQAPVPTCSTTSGSQPGWVISAWNQTRFQAFRFRLAGCPARPDHELRAMQHDERQTPGRAGRRRSCRWGGGRCLMGAGGKEKALREGGARGGEWRGSGLSDEELDAAYNVRRKAGEELFARHMERYRAESERAVDGLPGRPGIVYDEASGERLDVWGTGEGLRPVFVYLHGGYWMARSRDVSSFVARGLWEQGVATVVPDYTLAPKASLEEIVRQVRACVAWVHRHGRDHGLDPERIVVGGS